MQDYKNTKLPEKPTTGDVIGALIFIIAIFGGWLILNLI